MVTNPILKIKNGCFGYKKGNHNIEILKGVNLEFSIGDVVAVIGINGSGKSTLLRSISGLLTPLAGEIQIENDSTDNLLQVELAKKVSVALTEKIGGFNLTCYDAVAAGRLPYTNIFNKLNDDHKKIINQAIEVCGLQTHQQKLLPELSDGLFQKTMIAKCIAQQAPLMILDEPSAFLDYASKHELFLLLKKLAAEQHKCIIVSSHDLDLVLKYCTRIVLVKNSAAESVPINTVKDHPSFKELSGGFL